MGELLLRHSGVYRPPPPPAEKCETAGTTSSKVTSLKEKPASSAEATMSFASLSYSLGETDTPVKCAFISAGVKPCKSSLAFGNLQT